MRTLHLLFLCVLIALCTYALYRTLRKEKQDQKLVHYIEAYFSSMMPPQINNKELFVWFSGWNAPVFNAVTHFYYQNDIDAHINAILEKAPKDKPISFWVDALQDSKNLVKELEAHGFKKAVTCPFMTWQVTKIEKPSVTIKRTNNNTIDTFNSLIGSIFGLDAETQQGFGIANDNSPAENYLVYADDTAIGVGTLFITDNVGLILNIGILPEYQKKGFGSAISQFLMHRTYELNLNEAVLNASPAAIAMYQKLGFVKAYDLDIYAK